MADYYREQAVGVPENMKTWYQEVGHESHGEVVSASEIWRTLEFYDSTAYDHSKEWVVPDDEEWRVLWIMVRFTTTATVGTRQLCVAVYQDDGARVQGILATPGATQAASLTRWYQLAPGLADLTTFRDTDYLTTPLPNPTILRQQWRLRIYDNKAIDPLDSLLVGMAIATRKVSN